MPTVNLSKAAYQVLDDIRTDLQDEIGLKDASFSAAVMRLKKLATRDGPERTVTDRHYPL